MMATTQRQKLAQLTSSIGAGILGVGIGALAASTLRGLEIVVIAVGLALHLWGMIDNHRAERGTPQPVWATATYWFCWVGLVALVGVMVVRAVL
jgi:hypothetical protein